MPYIRKSKSQLWSTPPELLKFILDTKTFYDPCPASPREDGLTVDWKSRSRKFDCIYVNPPFKTCAKWVERAARFAADGLKIALLLPVRTHTKYFQKYLSEHTKVVFLPKKYAFIDQSTGEQAGVFQNSLMVCYFNWDELPHPYFTQVRDS